MIKSQHQRILDIILYSNVNWQSKLQSVRGMSRTQHTEITFIQTHNGCCKKTGHMKVKEVEKNNKKLQLSINMFCLINKLYFLP